jgi:FMN-dependent NADH-azoreductase
MQQLRVRWPGASALRKVSMNILFVGSSPRGSESSSKQVATHLVGKLQQDHPDTYANEIIEARRALVAELEQRRRSAAVAG